MLQGWREEAFKGKWAKCQCQPSTWSSQVDWWRSQSVSHTQQCHNWQRHCFLSLQPNLIKCPDCVNRCLPACLEWKEVSLAVSCSRCLPWQVYSTCMQGTLPNRWDIFRLGGGSIQIYWKKLWLLVHRKIKMPRKHFIASLNYRFSFGSSHVYSEAPFTTV